MGKKKAFHVIPEINMSLATPEELTHIQDILNRFNITFTKITAGQRLAVYGTNETHLQNLRRELFRILPKPPKISVNYVQTCPQFQDCKYATTDSQPLGRRLEQLAFTSPLPSKVKVSIADCKMCCTEPYLRDIGIIGSRKGWTLVFGGNGGGKPRIADVIAENLDDDQVVDLVTKCIAIYSEQALPKNRTARFIEQIGIEEFKKTVLG